MTTHSGDVIFSKEEFHFKNRCKFLMKTNCSRVGTWNSRPETKARDENFPEFSTWIPGDVSRSYALECSKRMWPLPSREDPSLLNAVGNHTKRKLPRGARAAWWTTWSWGETQRGTLCPGSTPPWVPCAVWDPPWNRTRGFHPCRLRPEAK